MTASPSRGVFPGHQAREHTSLARGGRAIERLNAVRVAVEVGGHQAEFLSWGFYEPSPWRNYLHTHSFYEICYAYAGRGVFRTGAREYPVEAGAVFVARPGDVHEIVSSDDDPLGIHFWSYTLIPVRAAARSGSSDHDHGRALLAAFAEPAAPVLSRRSGQVPAILELLCAEAANPGPGVGDVVRNLAGLLVVETARAVVDDQNLTPEPAPEAPTRDEQMVRTMVRYLRDNYDRPVRVRDVAAQVHVSERHASRLFRVFTGTTIHAFLVRLRLEIAAQRLLARAAKAGPVSIAEVARSCGYPDVRHFTTVFRRHWGVTPGAFRSGDGTAHLPTDGPTDGPTEKHRPRAQVLSSSVLAP
ncbi:AraC family transcriptional regulator [Thermasporomyces composti]|uniref:AraC-like DNA-binding protein n=1 Tax=Thermasporomyces composti TaxID=696763 RepID=A0A3D9V3Q5_THECX|nr:AraC family transcriptional regulator [Thermasporomyces composti]REF36442.1 AraC-like DNA-binding protein [Thermasporomyces composti]